MNAVRRTGARTPVELHPDDFEVHRAGQLSRTATAVVLDLSWSMALSGAFQAGKKVALALQSLISLQYPRDDLAVFGFSARAREITAHDLPGTKWDENAVGTNFQHALMTARRRLGREHGGTRQILLVTDGAPNSWVDGSGQTHYAGRGSAVVRRELLKEVGRCTRSDIVVNIFMLGDDPDLKENR